MTESLGSRTVPGGFHVPSQTWTEGGIRGSQSRATLTSVAAMAGVSKQTVSNVLNAPHLVRAETARKVQTAIKDLGYRPHRAAQQLRTRRSRVLGLRVEPAAGDKVFDRFVHALTEAAGALDYRIMLYTAADERAEIKAYDELLDRWDIDGFVLTTTHPGDRRTTYLAGAKVPCVTFGRPWDGSDHHSWVDVDGAAGTRLATEHLIAAGHQRIGFLGWPAGSGVGDDRLSGWEQALAAAKLPRPEPGRCLNDMGGGRYATAEILDRVEVTALVCVSDTVGLGCLAERNARDRSAGGGTAVIGFDDSDLADVVGLTSVSQPLAAVARECVRLLTELVETSHPHVEHVLLQPHLKIRTSSCGP